MFAYGRGKTVNRSASQPPESDGSVFRTDHLMGDLKGRSVRGGVITLTSQAAKLILQTASTMILARLLAPQDFGLVAMVTAVTGFVAIFKEAGLSAATIQNVRISHGQVSNLFWINVGLSASIVLVVAGSAPLIAWLYHEPRLIWIAIALSGTFLLSGLAVQHQALLRRQMRFKALVSIEIGSLTAGIVSAVLAALLGCGYWSLVAMMVMSSAVEALITWTVSDWRPSRPNRATDVKSMIRFGGSVVAFDFLNYFNRNFDNILIGNRLGPQALGLYSRAYSLLLLPIRQVNGPLTGVLMPALSRLQGDREGYARFYLKAIRLLAAVNVPLVVFAFAFAEDVVRVVLGRQWIAAVPAFRLLAPAALVGAINVAPGWLCVSLGRPERQLHYGLVSMPVCVTGFCFGLRWGIEGVAAAFGTLFFFLFWAFVWYACRGTAVKASKVAGGVLVPFLLSSVAGVITWLLRIGPLAHAGRVLALCVCGTSFAALYFLGAMLVPDMRQLLFRPLAFLRLTGRPGQ